jgi:hypothetical protein
MLFPDMDSVVSVPGCQHTKYGTPITGMYPAWEGRRGIRPLVQ